jgi:EmrB/QacA subfamily drug resistance transporter
LVSVEPDLTYGSARGRWVIAATVLGSGMAAIDATVVGIALPTIGREFHASLGGLQWVVNGYTLALSALLLLGGSLGDQYGRRRIFTIGVAWFTLASAACGLAPNTGVLVALRILQGVGAALLTPGSLAIIQASFDERDRGRAIGAWTGLGGVATAIGPFVGGWLIAAASWRWIFFINMPIGVAVLVISSRHVPETHDPDARGRIDVEGAVLGFLALAGITFGLVSGPELGWHKLAVILPLVGGVLAGVAFVVVERTSAAPMLPLELFRRRQFTVTNTVTFIVYAALGGVLFLLPVVLQVVGRYTPLESGVALLPLTAVMLLLSARSGRLAGRIGPRLQMSVGPMIIGVGIVLLARVGDDTSYLTGVLPAMLVFGFGLATVVAPLTATALSSAPAEHSGMASAVNNDVARVGGLIAVALLPVLTGITGTGYLHPVQLAHGFRIAAIVAGLSCVGAGILAAFGIRNPAPVPPEAERAAAPEPVPLVHCGLDGPPLVNRRTA